MALRDAARIVVSAYTRLQITNAKDGLAHLREVRAQYLAECIDGLQRELAVTADADALSREINARRAGDHPLRMQEFRQRFNELLTAYGAAMLGPDKLQARAEAWSALEAHVFGRGSR